MVSRGAEYLTEMSVSLKDVHSLPIFPSSSTLRSLHPSHQSSVLNKLQSVLNAAIALPDEHLTQILCSDFVSSYAEECASDMLQSVVFTGREAGLSRNVDDMSIRKAVLNLTVRLSSLPMTGNLSLSTIQDLCVVYGAQNSSKMSKLIASALQRNPTLFQDVKTSVIPSYASILASSRAGLHGIRKASLCLQRFLRCAPPEVLEEFVKTPDFVLSISRCYGPRMNELAATYGGIDVNDAGENDTTIMWLQTKVTLLDCFHVLMGHLLAAVKDDPSVHSDQTISILHALSTAHLDSSPSPLSSEPFLNRPLLTDYQDAYDLAASLLSTFANSQDPRRGAINDSLSSSVSTQGRRPGALKILLRSNGGTPGIDYGGSKANGTTATATAKIETTLMDSKVSSVLEILPDQDPEYVKRLLSLPQYSESTEQVIAALLEGDAPPSDSLKRDMPVISERRNIFNEAPMEASSVTIGKRRADADTVIQDRSFIDQMKADILRRAAELSESDEEYRDDDELDGDLDDGVRVVNDGEGSESGDSEGEERTQAPKSAETICELAYIRDSKLFDRDAETRRSKARTDLKTQTGWTDEQIEGWRIMLDRNVS